MLLSSLLSLFLWECVTVKHLWKLGTNNWLLSLCRDHVWLLESYLICEDLQRFCPCLSSLFMTVVVWHQHLFQWSCSNIDRRLQKQILLALPFSFHLLLQQQHKRDVAGRVSPFIFSNLILQISSVVEFLFFFFMFQRIFTIASFNSNLLTREINNLPH